ncbi:hypothetical protein R4553_17920 [Acinetobacter baumannii]|nr:hypothetical protein [Acinetobacter baumannii]
MNNSQTFFYHFVHISVILLLVFYFFLMFIERMYIKRNLSKICKLAFNNASYFTKIDLGNFLVLSFLPIVIQVGFFREKIILKKKVVFPNPPILFPSINDKNMEIFFKKYKPWLYISNLKWLFGILWFIIGGIMLLNSK